MRDAPGACPICGVALEPWTIAARPEESPELAIMTRRFWISAALAAPVLAIAMSDPVPGQPLQHRVSPGVLAIAQLVLARRRSCSGAARDDGAELEHLLARGSGDRSESAEPVIGAVQAEHVKVDVQSEAAPEPRHGGDAAGARVLDAEGARGALAAATGTGGSGS